MIIWVLVSSNWACFPQKEKKETVLIITKKESFKNYCPLRFPPLRDRFLFQWQISNFYNGGVISNWFLKKINCFLLFLVKKIPLLEYSMSTSIFWRSSWHQKNRSTAITLMTNWKVRQNPADTGRKLNVHKTFRRRPGRLLNVFCTFNLRPVPTENMAE